MGSTSARDVTGRRVRIAAEARMAKSFVEENLLDVRII